VCRFSCCASLLGTARLAGRAGPWPASAGEGEERTPLGERNRVEEAATAARSRLRARQEVRRRPSPCEIGRSPRSRGRRREELGVEVSGRSRRFAAGPSGQAATVDVAEAGGELPPSLLPRELGLTRGKEGGEWPERGGTLPRGARGESSAVTDAASAAWSCGGRGEWLSGLGIGS
jgi:hypothetical protein